MFEYFAKVILAIMTLAMLFTHKYTHARARMLMYGVCVYM